MRIWKIVQSIWVQKTGENESLNGLRALAIISVLLFHTVPSLQMIGWGELGITKFFVTLDSGVALFFVLSGYLISGGLKKEWNQNSEINFKLFFIKRSLRIFPAYYFYLFITYLLVTAILKKGGSNLSLNPNAQSSALSLIESYKNFKFDLLYLSDYFPSYNIHTWSLSIEEKFYLLFPFVAGIFLFRFNFKQKFVLLSILYSVPLLFRIIYYNQYGSYTDAFHAFHIRFDDLMAGIIIMEISSHLELMKKLQKYWQYILLIAFVIYATNFYFITTQIETYITIFSYNFYNISFALLLLVAILGNNHFQSFLSFFLFRPIARLSYTMYLWNLLLAPFAFQTLVKPFQKNGYITPGQFGIATLHFFLLTFLVSTVLYIMIEFPFLKWKSILESKERNRQQLTKKS
ncbi:acyltransferase [Leptospira biflexa]|uniref:acyltransferase family protein n=1 Tax=Leptospira biflexa TaxID=172 RepID=UPI0010823226|nr:acyltransferase [Leptospira biflexa]TGM37897.1 acyltransferase [Leptospira biflexa]TGM41228.1 acyltransferase [Leptospira biflexa]TGM47430.1 acyltransferase [Leptospira biflexa]TGM50104.1 acyltransferase [Leptospira biflexa]